MMVFPGLGGNGDSQLNGQPPYDNIWPHSSDLQNSYVDANGEKGYVTHDQSHDLEGHPLFWTDTSRTKKTTTDTGIPVYVRVGPYNVNPESAITYASVISHEYGHSLGLPDYYSTGSRTTYGGWTLMAEDHSQNIDAIGKKELGWLVPRVIEPGTTQTVSGWEDSKNDTGRIDWKTPDGTPYTLTGPGIHNGQGYVANLPGRRIIDPAAVPSGSHLYWSGSGNGFGCPPAAGHNLDLALPSIPAGTQKLTLSFKSRWDTEWDFDYGFVLGSADNGKTYTSYPSANGYTATTNPNNNDCQAAYNNGLTGSSGSFAAGTQTVDRLAGNYPAATFVADSYDISNLIGKPGAVLRFAYATDPGLARPGWFIDDLQIKADDKVIYSSDFENANDTALFNGGCREGLQTAQACTHGWQYVAADQNSPAEHAYLMELRDRSGFDAHGMGESDRAALAWDPGLLLDYTDEDHGYGNVGTDDPPAQTPLDSRPEPGSDTPNLDDAAFKAGDAYSDAGAGHTDNYLGADGKNWVLNYDCLAFTVGRMAGTDVGPEVFGAYDLNADVTFNTTGKCGQFDYGNGAKSAGGVPIGGPATPPAQEAKAMPISAPAGAAPKPAAAVTPPVACKARAVKVRAPLSSFRTTCPSFGAKSLAFSYRLKKSARVRVDLYKGSKLVKRVAKLHLRKAKHTYSLKLAGKGLKAGDYTLRLRALRAGKTVTLKLPVTRTR